MSTDQPVDLDVEQSEATSPATEQAPVEDTEPAKVYDAEYVAKLRQEAAEARVKAKRVDGLSAQLLSAFVALDGRLIDPDDLPFTLDLVDDDGNLVREKITAAIDALIDRKPHLAARRPTKPVAQGAKPEPEPVSLHAMMRERA